MGTIGSARVVGVFSSALAARNACDTLRRAGVPDRRIALSADLTADGIAAEVPGQSFENQPGQPAEPSRQARFGEAVRSAGCVVSVLARSDEERHFIEALLNMEQAYRTGCLPVG
jgi:hypothetical protein